MSTEFVGALSNGDISHETSEGNDPSVNVALNSALPSDLRGVPLPKFVRGGPLSYGYTSSFRIPANLTLGTGLTFKFYISDDGQNAADLGAAVVLGVTLKRLAANNTTNLESGTGLATEQTATVTLSSTAGGIAIGSLAIANANLPASTAVGDLLAIRIRRLGNNASDTCQNRVILYSTQIQNT